MRLRHIVHDISDVALHGFADVLKDIRADGLAFRHLRERSGRLARLVTQVSACHVTVYQQFPELLVAHCHNDQPSFPEKLDVLYHFSAHFSIANE